jgi:hypothetical protein
MIDNAAFYIDNFSNQEFELLTDRLDVKSSCNKMQNRLWFDFVNLRVNYYP